MREDAMNSRNVTKAERNILRRYRNPQPGATIRNPAIAYDPASQLEDIYHHHNNIISNQTETPFNSSLQPPFNSAYQQQRFNQPFNGFDPCMATQTIINPNKIELIKDSCCNVELNNFNEMQHFNNNKSTLNKPHINNMIKEASMYHKNNNIQYNSSICNCSHLDVIATAADVCPLDNYSPSSHNYPEIISGKKIIISQ